MPRARLLVALALVLSACGGRAGPPAPERAPSPPSPSASLSAAASAPAPEAAAPEPSCPDGMLLVDEPAHCTEVKRRCLDDEYNKANKITLCHRFAEEAPRCVGETRRQRFCIDRYEYPNQEGARSPVMLDWHDARAICESEGKRLCFESEWVSACEGPEHLPFPHGYERRKDRCNIDNPWKEPSLKKLYSTEKSVAERELGRLDQGVPAGSMPECKSGYGVHDLTGNVDEWVALDRPRGKGGWAGLKGGAWGHVRNACRPVTTSHTSDFTYYFISFRCCADARGPAGDGPTPWRRPELPAPKKSIDTASRGFTPSR